MLGQNLVYHLGQRFTARYPCIVRRPLLITHFMILSKQAIALNLIKHRVKLRLNLPQVKRRNRHRKQADQRQHGANTPKQIFQHISPVLRKDGGIPPSFLGFTGLHALRRVCANDGKYIANHLPRRPAQRQTRIPQGRLRILYPA